MTHPRKEETALRNCLECEQPMQVKPSHIKMGKYKFCGYKCRKANGVNWGERSGKTRLTWTDVAAIREIYKRRKFTLAMLAAHYRVCKKTIQHIVEFRTWALRP